MRQPTLLEERIQDVPVRSIPTDKEETSWAQLRREGHLGCPLDRRPSRRRLNGRWDGRTASESPENEASSVPAVASGQTPRFLSPSPGPLQPEVLKKTRSSLQGASEHIEGTAHSHCEVNPAGRCVASHKVLLAGSLHADEEQAGAGVCDLRGDLLVLFGAEVAMMCVRHSEPTVAAPKLCRGRRRHPLPAAEQRHGPASGSGPSTECIHEIDSRNTLRKAVTESTSQREHPHAVGRDQIRIANTPSQVWVVLTGHPLWPVERDVHERAGRAL